MSILTSGLAGGGAGGAGQWQFIQAMDLTTTTTYDLSADYDTYKIVFENVISDLGADGIQWIGLQLSDDGGASYKTGAADYDSAATADDASLHVGFCVGQDSYALRHVSECVIFNMKNSSIPTVSWLTYTQYNKTTPSGVAPTVTGAIEKGTLIAADHFKLLVASSTTGAASGDAFASGNCYLYGMKKA